MNPFGLQQDQDQLDVKPQAMKLSLNLNGAAGSISSNTLTSPITQATIQGMYNQSLLRGQFLPIGIETIES